MTFKEWRKLIDTNKNGRITVKELKDYYDTYVKDVKADKDEICAVCGKGAVIPEETHMRCHCGMVTKEK